MNPLARHICFAISGTALLLFLFWGVSGLAPFGHYPGPYGDILNAVAVQERHVLNVVTAVIFDYRGFDTLGEEFILFASVTGVVLVMRHEEEAPEDCAPHALRQPRQGAIDPAATDATRVWGVGFIGAIIVFGIYTVLTGHLSLGGGFQGGVILSAAWLLTCLAYGSDTFHYYSEQSLLEWFEAGGAGAYGLIGCIALIAGKNFLTNVLPLGQTGQLLSSGTILLINCAVGIEVTAGFVLVLREFIRAMERETPLRDP